jgi:hypothetical protein
MLLVPAHSQTEQCCFSQGNGCVAVVAQKSSENTAENTS